MRLSIVQDVERRLRSAWALDSVRFVVLTAYYLGLIATLVAIYGDQQYTPPPFIYQGF
jgi:hypothetical protein